MHRKGSARQECRSVLKRKQSSHAAKLDPASERGDPNAALSTQRQFTCARNFQKKTRTTPGSSAHILRSSPYVGSPNGTSDVELLEQLLLEVVMATNSLDHPLFFCCVFHMRALHRSAEVILKLLVCAPTLLFHFYLLRFSFLTPRPFLVLSCSPPTFIAAFPFYMSPPFLSLLDTVLS